MIMSTSLPPARIRLTWSCLSDSLGARIDHLLLGREAVPRIEVGRVQIDYVDALALDGRMLNVPWAGPEIAAVKVSECNVGRCNGLRFAASGWGNDVDALRAFEEKEARARTVVGIEESDLDAIGPWNRNRLIHGKGLDVDVLDSK